MTPDIQGIGYPGFLTLGYLGYLGYRLPWISGVSVTPDIWGDRYPGNSQVGCVSQLRVNHLTPCIRFDMRLTRFEPNASQMARARLSI